MHLKRIVAKEVMNVTPTHDVCKVRISKPWLNLKYPEGLFIMCQFEFTSNSEFPCQVLSSRMNNYIQNYLVKPCSACYQQEAVPGNRDILNALYLQRSPALSTRDRVLRASRKHRHLQTPSVSPATDVSPPMSPTYSHIKSRIIYLLCNEILLNRSRSPTCVHIARLAKLTRTAYFLFQNKRTLFSLDGLGAIKKRTWKIFVDINAS